MAIIYAEKLSKVSLIYNKNKMKLCRVGKVNKEKPALIDKAGNYGFIKNCKDFNPATLNFETIEKLKV